MTRAYGRAMSSLGGLVAPMMMIGSLTGPAFIDYIERCVVPQLSVDDVVVLDNLGAHRMAAVQHAIEEAGASVIFLPPTRPTSIRSISLGRRSRRSSANSSHARSPISSTRPSRHSEPSPSLISPTGSATRATRPDPCRCERLLSGERTAIAGAVGVTRRTPSRLSLIHISEPTRPY